MLSQKFGAITDKWLLTPMKLTLRLRYFFPQNRQQPHFLLHDFRGSNHIHSETWNLPKHVEWLPPPTTPIMRDRPKEKPIVENCTMNTLVAYVIETHCQQTLMHLIVVGFGSSSGRGSGSGLATEKVFNGIGLIFIFTRPWGKPWCSVWCENMRHQPGTQSIPFADLGNCAPEWWFDRGSKSYFTSYWAGSKATWSLQLTLWNDSLDPEGHKSMVDSAIELLLMILEEVNVSDLDKIFWQNIKVSPLF